MEIFIVVSALAIGVYLSLMLFFSDTYSLEEDYERADAEEHKGSKA